MSALNVILTSDSVAVLTDGAAYQIHDGRPVVAHLAHKVMLLPYHRAALAFRGHYCLAVILPGMTVHADTFDGLVDGLAERFRSGMEELERLVGPLAVSVSEILLFGWSERDDQPQAWYVTNRDQPKLPAWSLIRLYGLISPAVPDQPPRHGMDPVVDGLRVMRAQREITTVAGEPFMCGGFAQLTVCTRRNVMTRILERWPETVREIAA